MKKKTDYIIKVFQGTESFALKELKKKYPKVEIKSQKNGKIVFSSEISNIEAFRNLYSPTYIESGSKKLNLFRRNWKIESVPAGLNPSLAYILCMIADCKEDDILCDPFCGASTISITALKYFNVKRVLCSDISGSAVEKSLENFKNADIPEEKYKVFKVIFLMLNLTSRM
jgi:tRNA G10  N-methylase Trm11